MPRVPERKTELQTRDLRVSIDVDKWPIDGSRHLDGISYSHDPKAEPSTAHQFTYRRGQWRGDHLTNVQTVTGAGTCYDDLRPRIANELGISIDDVHCGGPSAVPLSTAWRERRPAAANPMADPA